MRIINKLFFLIAGSILLSSCYDDLSTEASFTYNDIVLEVPEAPGDTISVGYGDVLKLKAIYSQDGVDVQNLSVEWAVDILPGASNTKTVISEDAQLEYLVMNSPVAEAYTLSVTVKNEKDGYAKTKAWDMYVVNAFGEGILAAVTNDGGATSTLNLYKAPVVTYGCPANDIHWKMDLYGLCNDGAVINGRVNSMLARSTSDLDILWKSFGVDCIMVATDRNLMMLSAQSYKILREDDMLFNNPPRIESFVAENLGNSGGVESHCTVNGEFYTCGEILDCQYARPPYPNDVSNVFSSKTFCGHRADQGSVCVFDPNKKTFYSSRAWSLFQGSFTEVESNCIPEKDWLADKTPVAAGPLENRQNAFVLKDAAGKYWCVVLDLFDMSPARIFELNLPGVEDAIGWEFCDNAMVFYYYTDIKVYATSLSGKEGKTQLLDWRPDNNKERVTALKHYTQAWWGTHQYGYDGYDFEINTNKMQIIILTYNPTTNKSKFYFKPYIVSTGKFSMTKDNGTCSIDGEVTAFCSTMR